MKRAAILTLNDFVEHMLLLLPRLVREAWQYDEAFVGLGELTVPQYWALGRLAQGAPCTMCELADYLHLKSSTATGLTDRLVRRGLVARRRSPADRRVVLVTLTARGRRVMDRMVDHKRKVLRRGFSPLSPAERSQYLAMIEKMLTGLTDGSQSAAPRGGAVRRSVGT
jgi:DNA-binding MarR family transcriptional regulator